MYRTRIRLLVILPILISWISGYHYVQGQGPNLSDSLDPYSSEEFGRQQAISIATYIRYANLQEVDHTPIKPLFEKAIQWERDNPDPEFQNTIRLGEVNIFLAEGELEKAVRRLQEILHSGETLSSQDSISTYTFLFDIYNDVAAHTEAWEMLRIRDKILERNLEDNLFMEMFRKRKLSDLAMMYLLTDQDEKAIQQFHRLILLAKSKNDLHFQAGAHNNLGFTYLEIGMPDSAIKQFHLSLECWRLKLSELQNPTPSDLLFTHLIAGNIGQAYVDQGRFMDGIALLEKDLEECRKQDYASGTLSSLHRLSNAYLHIGKPEKALEYLKDASRMISPSSSIDKTLENKKLKVDVYEALGRVASALVSHKEWVAFKDSVEEVKNQSRVRIMEIVYEVEQTNRQVARQKLQLVEAEAKASIQRERQIALVIGCILMIVIIALMFILASQRKRKAEKLAEKNKEILEQKGIIQRSLTEKETLLKEVYHRVKNNLQMISGILELQAIQVKDERVREMMEESQSRVRSIAMIHQQLYQSDDLGQIDFEKYLSKLIYGIATLCKNPDTEVEYLIDVNGHSFSLSLAVSLGLIINELVTNSFKHGFDGRSHGKISVQIQKFGESEYELWVKDDGIGFPPDLNPLTQRTLGIRLVKGISRQLEGTCSFSNSKGTTFKLQFKVDHGTESNSHTTG